jgi:hypothetical protein
MLSMVAPLAASYVVISVPLLIVIVIVLLFIFR